MPMNEILAKVFELKQRKFVWLNQSLNNQWLNQSLSLNITRLNSLQKSLQENWYIKKEKLKNY